MATPIPPQTLFEEAVCYMCFGPLSAVQTMRLAYLARIVRIVNPMAAIDPQSLVEYGRCFACFSNASVGDMMELALLDQMAQNITGGGGGASCLVCGDVDPVTPSTCTCGLYVNTTTGGVWYWSANPPWNPGVPEWTVLIAGV